MKLTKSQILFIENYLIDQGVKYWDVRVELIDHVATKLEENDSLELTRTFLIKEFGTAISLDKIVEVKRKTLLKKFQKLGLIEIKGVFISSKKISLFILLLTFYSIAFFELSGSNLKWFILSLYAFPLLSLLFFGIRYNLKKQKSIQVESAKYFMLSLVIAAQTLLQVNQFDKIGWFKLFMFIFTILYFLIFYGGVIVFNRTRKEYDSYLKELELV